MDRTFLYSLEKRKCIQNCGHYLGGIDTDGKIILKLILYTSYDRNSRCGQFLSFHEHYSGNRLWIFQSWKFPGWLNNYQLFIEYPAPWSVLFFECSFTVSNVKYVNLLPSLQWVNGVHYLWFNHIPKELEDCCNIENWIRLISCDWLTASHSKFLL